MKLIPSNVPVVENDQHEPHCPWFLIGVTAPLALQSNDDGYSLSFPASITVSSATSNSGCGIKHPFKAPNSSDDKSANSLSPTDEVWLGSEFQFMTK